MLSSIIYKLPSERVVVPVLVNGAQSCVSCSTVLSSHQRGLSSADSSPTKKRKKGSAQSESRKGKASQFRDAPDRSKMTMQDLIYYNPSANPMRCVRCRLSVCVCACVCVRVRVCVCVAVPVMVQWYASIFDVGWLQNNANLVYQLFSWCANSTLTLF